VDESAVLAELEELARSLDIEGRYENLRREGIFTPGGLCRVKGRYLLIVHSKALNRDKIEALAAAVTRFDLSHLYMKPGLRDFLDRFPVSK
jgi:hypothetical protein